MKNNVYIISFILVFFLFFLLLFQNQKNVPVRDFSSDKSYKVRLNETYLLNEEFNDSISLSSITQKHPMLILRIPSAACQECKLKELENLKLNFSEDEIENICVIMTIITPRDLKVLTSIVNFNFLKLGSFKQNIFNIKEDFYNRPYYFILNSNLDAEMFFYPDNNQPELTCKYFKTLKLALFNK